MIRNLPKKAKSNNPHKAFTLIELLVVITVITLLLAILVPVLRKARALTKRIVCQSNLRQIALAWHIYLDDNDGAFCQRINANHEFGGWKGMGSLSPRPLNKHISLPEKLETEADAEVFRCPADKGGIDCGSCAYLCFGNSYQTNIMLIGPDQLPADGYVPEPWKTLNIEINKFLSNLKRDDVSTPSRLLLVGDNNWVTQWDPLLPFSGKAWHGKRHHYNLAFLDGHVEFLHIRKGLYITNKYTVLPFKSLYGLAREVQVEEP